MREDSKGHTLKVEKKKKKLGKKRGWRNKSEGRLVNETRGRPDRSSEGGNRTGSMLKAGLHLGPYCGL